MSDTKYPDFIESTGYGTGDGLCGWNCRHHFQAWDERLRNPYTDENGNLKIDTEENYKRYELQQKQRAMDRSIRATKRKLIEKQEQINLIAETDVKDILQKDYDKLSYRMTQQNKTYNDFCKANDLQPQYDRIKVADFGREQTKRSSAGARRYKNSLNISQGQNTIKERISNGEYSLSLSRQQYLKHVDGTKQYQDYVNSRKEKGQSPQGRIIISDTEVQDIIKKYSGTGIPKTNSKGVSNIEFVSAEKIVGQYFKDGEWIDTKRVAIHHGKKASHIVPVEESND